MSKLWNGLFHHCGCKLNSSLCIRECRECHIFFCCLLEVDSLWTSNVLHLECYREGCEQLEHKIHGGQLCYLWGGGWVGGLMELKMVVVKSCTSMQCFNLVGLSFHTVGSSLGRKCFSVLHSALIYSVQGSRTCWPDYIFFWGLIWSEKTCREDCPNPISALQYGAWSLIL